MKNESFGHIFKLEQVENWSSNYINYDEIMLNIKNLVDYLKEIADKTINQENLNDSKNEKFHSKKSSKVGKDNLSSEDKNIKNNNNSKKVKNNTSPKDKKQESHASYDFIKEQLNNKLQNNLRNEKEKSNNNIIDEEEEAKKNIEKKIKEFFESLDKEIKKIYIFYSTKEKDIYQKINKRVKNKELLSNKNPDEILKELDFINYMSELCKQIILFIYWNILALKNLLNTFDKSTKTISQSLSYLYMKKFLSKNNSDLLYILNFKTLDESLIAVEEILIQCEKIINKDSNYLQDKEKKKKFKGLKDGINENMNYYNSIYEKIFNEFTEWQKYLNINLKLPNSSHNSLFRNTSFSADSMPSNKEKIKYNKKSLANISDLRNEINDVDDDEEKISIDSDFSREEKKVLEKYRLQNSSDLFKENLIHISSIYHKKENIISQENYINLRIIYLYVFFYTYSYCIIISLLDERIITSINNPQKIYYLYGIVISLPILGNILSLLYINKLIKYDIKVSLLLSLLFAIIYYLTIILSMLLLQTKYYTKCAFFIVIGRLLLGLSSINLIGKEYINLYVPYIIQIECNQKYLRYKYSGYIFSFLFIGIQNMFQKKKKNDVSYIIIIFCLQLMLSCSFVFYITFLALRKFKNPKQKGFRSLSHSFSVKNRNKITCNIELEENEKEIIKEQEKNFDKANTLTLLSGINYLQKNAKDLEKNKKKYLNQIFICLIILLCTSQYTSENCLIILPIINNLEFYKEDYMIGLFSNSASFLIILLLQKKILIKISENNYNKSFLLFISIISIIIVSFQIICTVNGTFDIPYFFCISNSLMIIFSDFFKILTVNLFIKLLPFENFTFCCFNSNYFINLTNKVIRLIPGTLALFMFFSFKNNEKEVTKGNKKTSNSNINYFSIDLGFNLLLFILSLIFLLCQWNLKPSSFTRVLTSIN